MDRVINQVVFDEYETHTVNEVEMQEWLNILVLSLTLMVAEGLVWVTPGLAPASGCYTPMY